MKMMEKLTIKEFNDHQQKSFNVFSAHGIASLRTWLNDHMVLYARSEQSTRQGSLSSASSVTAPNAGGGASPTEAVPRAANPYYQYSNSVNLGNDGVQPNVRMGSAQDSSIYYDEDEPEAVYDYSYAYSMYSDHAETITQQQQQQEAASNRYATAPASTAYTRPVLQTGLEAAFASSIPNFLNHVPSPRITEEPGRIDSGVSQGYQAYGPPRQVSIDRSWPGVPGAYVSNSGRDSRASSISSVDTAPGQGQARRGNLRNQVQVQSAAAAFQAQYMAEQHRQVSSNEQAQGEGPIPAVRNAPVVAPPDLVREPSYRRRAHTTSSPLASNSFARATIYDEAYASSAQTRTMGTGMAMPGAYQRSNRVISPASSSVNPAPLSSGRALGGPSSHRSSLGNIHVLSQPAPVPTSYSNPPSAYQYQAHRSSSASRHRSGSAQRRADGQPPVMGASDTPLQLADRIRDRSGSGSSFSSLTEGLRGLGLRRQSVGQAVQAVQSAVEASPLRWVAELAGWRPDEQPTQGNTGGTDADQVGRRGDGDGDDERPYGQYLGGAERRSGGRRGTTG